MSGSVSRTSASRASALRLVISTLAISKRTLGAAAAPARRDCLRAKGV